MESKLTKGLDFIMGRKKQVQEGLHGTQRLRKMPKCKVISIQYVHHPEAAKKWFDLYAAILLKDAQKKSNKKEEELDE